MAFNSPEFEFQKRMREMQEHMERGIFYGAPVNDPLRGPLHGLGQQPAKQAEAKRAAPAAPAKAAHLNNKLLLTVKG